MNLEFFFLFSEKDNQVEQVEQKSVHPQPFAQVSVSYDSIYRMACQPRGIAVIINNKTFQEKNQTDVAWRYRPGP